MLVIRKGPNNLEHIQQRSLSVRIKVQRTLKINSCYSCPPKSTSFPLVREPVFLAKPPAPTPSPC